MFVGRRQELVSLNRRYESGTFEFPVIYGRRRIGKTALIREFIRGKRSAYFMCTQEDAGRQLEECSEVVLSGTGAASLTGMTFASWEKLFDYLAEVAKDERFVFAIDEYPYLAERLPEISSLIQKYVDTRWRQTQLFLILCGSSMHFMERQVLGYESPLYGRRTGQYKLEPLPYFESLLFFDKWGAEEKMLAYGICGGIPQYLQLFQKYRCLKDAVIGEFMSFDGHLLEEPQNLLKQELREPAVYYDILSAIANGAGRQNEIADRVGKERNLLSGYLANLCALNIVTKVHPVGEASRSKVRYQLCDNLYRFYFRFIPGSLSLIGLGMGERAYDSLIAPFLSEYFGHIFEDVCLSYVQELMRRGAIPELYREFGRWWGTDRSRKEQTDIDVVCMSDSDLLVGECKWKTDPITLDVYEELRHRGSLISGGRNVRYALFSRSGFTDTVREKAKDCLLVDLEAMEQMPET